MGLFDRLKQAFRRAEEPAVDYNKPLATTSQITASTTDYVVRHALNRIEPAIARGFEEIGIRLINEVHASEQRIIKELKSYIDGSTGAPVQAKPHRITQEEVLAEFNTASKQRIRDLKAALNANSSAIINHLRKLENEGLIARIGYGEYEIVQREFKETSEVHGEDNESGEA